MHGAEFSEAPIIHLQLVSEDRTTAIVRVLVLEDDVDLSDCRVLADLWWWAWLGRHVGKNEKQAI